MFGFDDTKVSEQYNSFFEDTISLLAITDIVITVMKCNNYSNLIENTVRKFELHLNTL